MEVVQMDNNKYIRTKQTESNTNMECNDTSSVNV